MDLVLFDADCPPCVALAGFAQRTASGKLRFRAWGEYRDSPEAHSLPPEILASPASRLRVVPSGTSALLEGESAWAFLLERHPALSGLDWLAARLGLAAAAPRALQSAGELLRRFCFKCPRA